MDLYYTSTIIECFLVALQCGSLCADVWYDQYFMIITILSQIHIGSMMQWIITIFNIWIHIWFIYDDDVLDLYLMCHYNESSSCPSRPSLPSSWPTCPSALYILLDSSMEHSDLQE